MEALLIFAIIAIFTAFSLKYFREWRKKPSDEILFYAAMMAGYAIMMMIILIAAIIN